MAANPSKILVARFGRAGDMVMITPALRALLGALPAAELHLLTSPEGERVLRGYAPRLTRTWIFDRRWPGRLLRRRQLGRALAGEGYGRVYVFEDRPDHRRWLRAVAPAVTELHALGPATPGVHFSERCLQAVDASLPGPVERGWVHLPVSDAGRERARALLRDGGIAPGGLLVGLHPSFSGSRLPLFRARHGRRHRNWPAASFGSLARILRDRAAAEGRQLAVVIDALPEERAVVAPVLEAAGGAITLLSAPPDWERYKGLLASLDVLVTPNTGPMHIAAAVGTPVVALFSGWTPADCGPYTDPRLCAVLRAEDTPHPARGLAAIAPQETAAAAWALLGARGRDGGGSEPGPAT